MYEFMCVCVCLSVLLWNCHLFQLSDIFKTAFYNNKKAYWIQWVFDKTAVFRMLFFYYNFHIKYSDFKSAL